MLPVTANRIHLNLPTVRADSYDVKLTEYNHRQNQMLSVNIYILDVFTENPYSKPMECNVVYIPITSSQATSVT